MHKDRLLALADYLETMVAKPQYNIAFWKRKNHSCGTVACTLGWAVESGLFVEHGLKWSDGSPMPYPAMTGFGAADPFKVGSKLFGISYREAIELFTPGHRYYGKCKDPGYPDVCEAAAALRAFVKEKEEEEKKSK